MEPRDIVLFLPRLSPCESLLMVPLQWKMEDGISIKTQQSCSLPNSDNGHMNLGKSKLCT
ncbi:hypothetical protein ES332_D06G197900v1 [Gossypium tomentosum]|uniref:Uncharacterized protein n=1 Tax=Gossypium tomentosum TaxID=34277 RepID=A0A5D2KKC7_GOSTO|nr:hypothetical protein ES332_D06G197900v1 [Gossypium tomentosum]